MPRALNIQGRDSFFDDPFFQEARVDFDKSVQRTLARFDSRRNGILQNSTLPADRAFSRTNMASNDAYASQALQVTEKDGKFQVLMDVKDFNPRNLQVRAVEDSRIVVEGKYQQTSEDGCSSSWKTFSKEFTLPEEADIDLVTTALSKDGILTIKAPRKENQYKPPNAKSNTVQSINESYNELRTPEVSATKSYKSTSSSTSSSFKTTEDKLAQSSRSFDSYDSGVDSLSRDVRNKLMVNEFGVNSVSSSNSSCSSPAPSEVPSEASRVSTTMEFDIGNDSKAANTQRSEVTFNVKAKADSHQNKNINSIDRPKSPDSYSTTSSTSRHSDMSKKDYYCPPDTKPVFMHPVARVPTFTAGCGSSGDTKVTVEEKDGKRTVTSERANLIQEKDGSLQSREIAAEINEKDGNSSRREAVTRIQRKHEDPDGLYKGAENSEASNISESCVKVLPDGTTMSVKKSSTSNSSQKVFSSLGSSRDFFDDPFFDRGITSDFGDLKSLMGRGNALMSQMSTDSMGSTLSERSTSSDKSYTSARSNVTERSHASDRSNTSGHTNSSGRYSRSTFSEQSNSFENHRSSNEQQPNARDRFGFSDRMSSFPESSLFSNRPSLAERFPEFSDALAEFDDMQRRPFPDFHNTGSFFSRSRDDNDPFASFESHFGRKF